MRIQLNLFVGQSEYEALPTPWNNAEWPVFYGQAYKDACSQIGLENCWVRPWETYIEDIPEVFRLLGVTAPPAIVFVDLDTSTALAAIAGRNIDAATIMEVYNRLMEYREFVDETGASGYLDRDNVFRLPEQIAKRESRLGLLGFNVFNLPIDLPAWLWLIGAAVTGYHALTANNKSGQAVFGASTMVLAGNYITKTKRA